MQATISCALMVTVFKTGVEDAAEADRLITLIDQMQLCRKITFDLEDCDRILRVESCDAVAGEIIRILNSEGYQCIEL